LRKDQEEDRHMRLATVALLAGLVMSGCGGDDKPGDGDKKPAASTPSATAPLVADPAAPLDEDALLGVHDALVTCAQGEKALGLVTHLSGNRSISDKEGVGGSEYNDRLAAPKATRELTRSGAQYVGLRMGKGGVDILIFPTDEEAGAGIRAVGDEAGTESASSGVFVNVAVKRSVSDAVRNAVERCEAEAMP
jgi:hypothetical protein